MLEGVGLASIKRENQKTYISVTAETEDGYNTTLLSHTLQDKLDGYELDEIELEGNKIGKISVKDKNNSNKSENEDIQSKENEKPKHSEEDILQLTAQAMCLEEMFSTTVSEGAIFYGETRRREVVAITEELKNEVCQIFEEMHQYYDRRYTPKVKYSKACASCSLKEICLPKLEKAGSVKEYLKRALEEEPG